MLNYCRWMATFKNQIWQKFTDIAPNIYYKKFSSTVSVHFLSTSFLIVCWSSGDKSVRKKHIVSGRLVGGQVADREP